MDASATEAFSDWVFLVVHGIARHDRTQIQETFSHGLAEHLNRSAGSADGRWTSEIEPIPDWKSEVRSIEFQSWDGEPSREAAITEIYESFWSPITRRGTVWSGLLSELGWVRSLVPALGNVFGGTSKIKLLSDIAALSALVFALVISGFAGLSAILIHLFVAFLALNEPPALLAGGLGVILATIATIAIVQTSFLVVHQNRVPRFADDPDIMRRNVASSGRFSWIFRPVYSAGGRRFYHGIERFLALGWQVVFCLFVISLNSRVRPVGYAALTFLVSMDWLILAFGIRLYQTIADRIRDLRIYLSTDENGENYLRKNRMIESLKRDLDRMSRRIIKKGKTKSLVLVGHSLGGKLIADAIVELADELLYSDNRRRRRRAKNIFSVLRAVIFAGSPLSLTERLARDRGRTAGEFRRKSVLAQVFDGSLQSMNDGFETPTLINFWCAADPVSGPLQPMLSTAIDVRISRLPWLLAHTAYFTSPQYWLNLVTILARNQAKSKSS